MAVIPFTQAVAITTLFQIATAQTISTGNSNYNLEGCYSDGNSSRAGLFTPFNFAPTKTVNSCLSFCAGNSKAYAGLEPNGDGLACLCSATLNTDPDHALQATMENCLKSICPESTEFCGGKNGDEGYWYAVVYVNPSLLPPPPPPPTTTTTTTSVAPTTTCRPFETALYPAPPSAICGDKGVITKLEHFMTDTYGLFTAAECAEICAETKDCVAFALNPTFCETLSAPIALLGLDTKSDSSYALYDLSCFGQKMVCSSLPTQTPP